MGATERTAIIGASTLGGEGGLAYSGELVSRLPRHLQQVPHVALGMLGS